MTFQPPRNGDETGGEVEVPRGLGQSPKATAVGGLGEWCDLLARAFSYAMRDWLGRTSDRRGDYVDHLPYRRHRLRAAPHLEAADRHDGAPLQLQRVGR